MVVDSGGAAVMEVVVSLMESGVQAAANRAKASETRRIRRITKGYGDTDDVPNPTLVSVLVEAHGALEVASSNDYSSEDDPVNAR